MNLANKCLACESEKIEKKILLKDWFLTHEEFEILQCENCGLKFTHPQPLVDRIGLYYQSKEYISHSNSRKGSLNFIYHQVRKYNFKRKISLLNSLTKSRELLDIGCSTGEFLKFAQSKGWNAKGVEPDENARIYATKNNNLEVYDENKLYYFEKKSFDIITMWHVLEHVHNPAERLQTIKSIIKENGVLIIAVPNPESWDAKKYKEYWAAYDVPRHLFHFNINSMKIMLERNGYELMKILPMKFDAYYVSFLSEKLKSGKLNFFHAMVNGFRSNFYAGLTGMNYSSLIYIAKSKITH